MKYILIIISLIALTSCEYDVWRPCKYKFKSLTTREVHITYVDCAYQVGDTVSLSEDKGDEWVIIKAYKP